MRAESALAVAAGFGIAAVAGLASLFWLRRATAGGKPLAPQAILGATALRFALSLAGVLVLTLVWRSEAVAGLVGVGIGYLALLVAETRWAIGRAGGRAGGRASKASAGEKE